MSKDADRLLADRLSALVEPVEAADWEDVQRRAQLTEQRGRLAKLHRTIASTRVTPVLASCLAGAALGATITGLAFGGSQDERDGRARASAADLSVISTPGSPVQLREDVLERLRGQSAHRREFADKFTGDVLLMGERGDRAFFRLPLRDGGSCFGGGFVGEREQGYTLGFLGCAGTPRFPSRALPILDLAVFHSSPQTGRRVVRMEGFAADGVAKIGVTDGGGAIIAETVVRDNIYKLTAYPPERARGLVGLDSAGAVVYSTSYPLARRSPLETRIHASRRQERR